MDATNQKHLMNYKNLFAVFTSKQLFVNINNIHLLQLEL